MVAEGGGAGLGTSTRMEATTVQKLALGQKEVLETEEMKLC